jgi:hypothetical protein
MSRLTRKVISIPAHSATDDFGRKTVAVVERFRFVHHAILRDRPNNLTMPLDRLMRGTVVVDARHAAIAQEEERVGQWGQFI